MVNRKTKVCKIYVEDWSWLHTQKGTIAEVLHTILTAKRDILKELATEYMQESIMPYVVKKMSEIKELSR